MQTYRVTVRLQAKAEVQAQMHGLSARLCSVPCPIYGRGSRFAKASPAPWLCQRTDFVHARHFFYAGVEPAHTRICSATSCDVFARVVWIKPWGETDLNFLLCPPPALACHARFLRLSRVCGRSLKEERLPLFVLFVLFGQAKSTWCFFVTFRTSEKYSYLLLLPHTFPTN